jgi:hypothetical protein
MQTSSRWASCGQRDGLGQESWTLVVTDGMRYSAQFVIRFEPMMIQDDLADASKLPNSQRRDVVKRRMPTMFQFFNKLTVENM